MDNKSPASLPGSSRSAVVTAGSLNRKYRKSLVLLPGSTITHVKGEKSKYMKTMNFKQSFSRLADRVTRACGSPYSFIGAFTIIVVWACTGPLFHFSDTWQLVINTGTTIITFLMVFVIQLSQNKDMLALQIKLNELLKAIRKADDNMINIEELTEDELQVIKRMRSGK